MNFWHSLKSNPLQCFEIIRFLGFGLLNTGITISFYQILVFFVSPNIAYTVTWIIGISFLMLFYPQRVFLVEKVTAKQRFFMGMIYVFTFCVGYMSLNFVIGLGIHERVAILFTLILTTVLNYFFMKRIKL